MSALLKSWVNESCRISLCGTNYIPLEKFSGCVCTGLNMVGVLFLFCGDGCVVGYVYVKS